MKISIIASRVLAGLSIAAAFAGIAVANTGSASTGSIQQPTPVSINDSTTFKKDFKQNGGNWNFNNQNANLNLSFDATQIKWDTSDPMNPKEVPLSHIDITSNTLQVDTILGGSYNEFNVENPLEDTYSFNINAKNGVTLNGATNVYHNSSIKSSEGAVTFGGAVNVDGANLDVTSKTGTTFNNALTINNKGNVNVTGDANLGTGAVTIKSGKLNVTGKLTSNGNNFTFGSLDNSWNNNNQGIYAKEM